MSDEPQFQHPQSQSSSQPAYGQVFTYELNTEDQANLIQSLTNRIQALENKRINWNTDIIGLFETVTVAPTLMPTSPYEQIKKPKSQEPATSMSTMLQTWCGFGS